MADDEQAAEPVEQILDRIPGAFAKTQQGRAQARRGEVMPLDELTDEPESDREVG
jgi:hypothetical protein